MIPSPSANSPSMLTPGEAACLAEWYECNPATGERGWTLHSGWVRGTRAEVRSRIQARPLFDCIVFVHDASPNRGDRTIL